jgi:hypothetical protein
MPATEGEQPLLALSACDSSTMLLQVKLRALLASPCSLYSGYQRSKAAVYIEARPEL